MTGIPSERKVYSCETRLYHAQFCGYRWLPLLYPFKQWQGQRTTNPYASTSDVTLFCFAILFPTFHYSCTYARTHTHAPHRHIYTYVYIYMYIWYLYRYISWNSSCDIHGSNTLLGWGWYLFIQQSEAGWGALECGAPRGLFAPRTRATFWLRSMSHSAPEAD